MILKSFIQGMLNHQKAENKIKYSTISALGTYLVLYSSLIPFSNNILEAFFPEIKSTYIKVADSSASTVIWCLGMCIQTSLIILFQFMRPYIISYAFPIFTSLYSASFYFMYLLGKKPTENFWFFFYLLLITSLSIGFIYKANLFFKVKKAREDLLIKTYKIINEDKN